MNKFIVVLACFILLACNSNGDGYKKPENALDAGREFINNSLKGRFRTAQKYMLVDSDNLFWLEKVSSKYNRMSEQEKAGFSTASININEVADVADSVTVINYSNSYTKVAQKVKVIKRNGEWLVDFKYTFSGNL